MRKILSKSDLFGSVDHIVDACAIALMAINSPIILAYIKEFYEYTDEEISQIKAELERFFEDEEE